MIALAAMMYSIPATTGAQPVAPGCILPEFIGAPCSTQTDIKEGTCTLIVKTPKKWKRKK